MPKNCRKPCLRLLLGAPQYAFIAPVHVLWGTILNGEKAMQRMYQFQSIDFSGAQMQESTRYAEQATSTRRRFFVLTIRQQPVALVF